jgi:hypothetical protein
MENDVVGRLKYYVTLHRWQNVFLERDRENVNKRMAFSRYPLKQAMALPICCQKPGKSKIIQ